MGKRAETSGTALWGTQADVEGPERNETLANTLDDGVYQLDAEGRFVAANDVIVELSRRDREDLLDDHVSALFGDEGAETIRREIDRLRGEAGARGELLDLSLRTAEGDAIRCEVRVSLLEADGDVQGSVGVVRNIPERSRRGREHQRVVQALEAAQEGISLLDDDGAFIYVNDAYADTFGYDPGEMIGRDWEELGIEADPEVFHDEVLPNLSEDGQWTGTSTCVRSDDSRFVAQHTLTQTEEEELICVVRDVSNREQRGRELQRKERRFEAIFEDPNILVGLLEPDGTVLDINQTAMEYIDADLDDVTGEPFWETPWWGMGDEVQDDVKEWTERAASGEYLDFEADLERPDGQQYTLEGYFRPVTNEAGEVVSVIVSDRDVTERTEHERALEESERRYRALAENFPNGIVTLFDHDLEYTLAAGQGFDDISIDPSDVEGEGFSNVWDDDTAEDLRPTFEAALDGEELSVEIGYADRDWIIHAVPITDERGDVFAGMTMAQDITERKERLRKIEENERRYRTLVENFPNGAVALFDENLEYTVAGGEVLEDVDTSAEEIEGATVWERYPEELAAQFEPNFRAAIENGESNEFEIEFHDRHWQAYTLPIRDSDGDIFAGMLMAQDVTEHKQREEQLEQTTARFEALFEKSPDMIDILDPDGRIVDVNRRLCETTGYSKDELTGMDIWELDDQFDEDEVRTLLANMSVGDIQKFDSRYRRRDGSTLPIEVNLIRIDLTGEDRFMAITRDVTERKQREQALRESKEQLRALIDLLPVAVFVAEADGEIVEWNEAAEEIWGGEVAVSQSVAEYEEYDGWWADTGDPVEPDEWALARALRGEEVTDPDVIEIGGFDGERRTVLNHGMPVRDADGEVSRAVVTLVDITERREYQRELEKSNERLEQFAYAASHDLQEPLRMVSSYLQLIERRYADELDEDGREFIEFAVDGADRMRNMIDGLLKYSRVDTRGDPFEPVDLDAVLADARDNLAVAIEESGARITTDSLPRVEGDAGQLRQLFQNLLDNAIEYSGDEPPRVHVSSERDGREWLISVSDEGIGIDPEDADRVFEVFQSLHARGDHQGMGIGLALCERIAERHGGEIGVESAPGEGATFTVTLPVTGAHSE